VLLDRWPRQRGREPPVDPSAARDALERLAYHLHSARRRDDLPWAEAVAELKTALGDRPAARALFDWLHGDVGLLVDYTAEDFGFVHLGIQEHLTARHLIAHPEALEVLAGDFDQSWWTEVFLQVSALSERAGFDRLMSQLLEHTDALKRRAGLLRDACARPAGPSSALSSGCWPKAARSVGRRCCGSCAASATVLPICSKPPSGWLRAPVGRCGGPPSSCSQPKVLRRTKPPASGWDCSSSRRTTSGWPRTSPRVCAAGTAAGRPSWPGGPDPRAATGVQAGHRGGLVGFRVSCAPSSSNS
jgi:hypothetical protein